MTIPLSINLDSRPIQTNHTSADQRIQEKTKVDYYPKFNLKTKSRQKVPLSIDGFNPYLITEEKEKQGSVTWNKTKISHVAGPIPNNARKINQSFLNPDAEYNDNIISNWIPHMAVSVVDENDGRPLSAAEANDRRLASSVKQQWIPHFFVNPMQDLDYMVIEALTRFTFIGPLMDALLKFLMGTGFRPELELINPSDDDDKNEKQVKENQDVIETLMQIDNQLNRDNELDLDTSFTDKIAALISVTNIFNRGALMFGYDKPIEVNGKSFKQIPSSLKFAHPRDLGIINVAPDTWRLRSVQWRNAYNMIPTRDMIYLWNPLISAKTRNSWWYGDSMIMPMLDASRVIRKNIGVNFPAMAETSWAGSYILAVRPEGQTLAEKQQEYTQVVGNMVTGAGNVMMEDPKNISFNNIDFNPKVNEFKELTEALIRYSVASTGLPHSMFYDESQSNRSTMLGKIQLATSTVINPMRQWISREISNQWYQRWFRLLAKNGQVKEELLKKFRIKMVFNDLKIAEWFDKVEAANEIRGPLTDEAYGEQIGIENYKNKVDTSGRFPMGGGGNTMKFGDGKNSFEIKKRNKEF